ncbi:MAG: S9 family peptidase [Saprospiraceae bacterium]|nr:S9 family peptidase [Saprospiraceae bacterium]
MAFYPKICNKFAIIILFLQINTVMSQKKIATIPVPLAKTIDTFMTIHGDTRKDPYYWLNNRENPEVVNYLNEENSYLDAGMLHTKPLQEKLYNELVGRIKQTDMSVPYFYNGYWYISKFEEGKQYAISLRKKGTQEAKEEILIDGNERAAGKSYYSLGEIDISPDNKIMAFSEDYVSRRQYTIRFKDLVTGRLLLDEIPNTSGSATWSEDNKYIFYSVKDESLREYKIFRHKIGETPSKDVEVYHEKDETFSVGIFKSRSKKFLIIGSFSTVSNEFRYVDAKKPLGDWKLFQPRVRDLEYSIDHAQDKFYIVTNLNAKNFKVATCGEKKTMKENWVDLVPHREDVLLEDITLFESFYVLSERKMGISRIRVVQNTGSDNYVDFGEEAYTANVSINPEFNSSKLRLSFTSMTTPNSVMEYEVSSRKLTLLKEQEVVGGYDKSMYKSERILVKSRDGKEIPMSIVYRKDFKKNGKGFGLQYGYGSYGYSMEPYFSADRLSLLDRGMFFAIAHIRGGQELGRAWYEDGKMFNKKNTFNDFIDCSEYLVKEKYCDKSTLFAMGGSAGGLLMGAVINLRPDLYKAVIASVPFVDVVTTMLDETIPLTTGEFDEWGNPKNEESYWYMKSYSPYDNIEKKGYPAMLVTTGLHDSQVQYWEPAKWVARLRATKTDNRPLYMFCNMSTGHGGASGRFERYKEVALEYAFLLDQAGIKE